MSSRTGAFMLLLIFFFFRICSVSALTNGVDALKSALVKPPKNWKGFDPCGTNWVGVTCNTNRVVDISLGNLNLEGKLPEDISTLSELDKLDLTSNPNLTGPLPPNIGNLKKLTEFHFGKNKLSGKIPNELFTSKMNLKHVRLDRNRLSGEIPASLNNLTNLQELDVSNNRFTSSLIPSWISSLDSLSTLRMEGIQLQGQIPISFFNHRNSSLETVVLKRNWLNETLDFGTSKTLRFVDLQYNDITEYKQPAKKDLQLGKQSCMSRAKWDVNQNSVDAPQLMGVKAFSFEDMRKCANNFSMANDVGGGGYGQVYKGILPSGQQIAIKRAQPGSLQGALEFKTEIELLSRVHHRNVVKLLGFCFDRGEQMLIYEYIPNGSLRDSLSETSNQGYLDPEYYMTNQLTEKSDVYGFGVMMLELLTGEIPIVNGKYVVKEVKMKMNKSKKLYDLQELLDSTIIATNENLKGFEKYVDLALICVDPEGVNRPSMNEVVKEIEYIMHHAGLNPNGDLAASSRTFDEASKGFGDPYGNNSFEYSASFPTAKIEPH
ncbi:hypothetical protein CARUB_v10028521mg [Capsella rubella]|uniref:non-specific serine/threonine protein kinase n=1 Tax=Capsella rubella TaxID=81985 RepID=R0GS28_9BRAS|nr:hypothetical protein CARUB_v10028521mg [Capsella rubella]